MTTSRSAVSRRYLVTGASAGIGAAFAEALARRGCDVVLTARREDRLHALCERLVRGHGIDAVALPADLADPASPRQLFDQCADAGIAIDGLINNAGYGLPANFLELDWRHHRDFIQVMVTAPVELVYLFLPGMLERRYGRIINVTSTAAHLPGNIGQTLYGGAKSLLVKFSQSVHAEVRGSGVHVTALSPGFTRSEFHDANNTRALVEGLPRIMWMGADLVAEQGLAAVERNRAIVVAGWFNKAVVTAHRLVPDSFFQEVVRARLRQWRERMHASRQNTKSRT